MCANLSNELKWLWHSQGFDGKRHPLIQYEFIKRLIFTKRIWNVSHTDISIESRVHLKLLTYEIKLSKFASCQLKLYLVRSKTFHMQLIKRLASEDVYLQMKNMLLSQIWKIRYAKKTWRNSYPFILTTWLMNTRTHMHGG